jgi:hypothetical protein
MRNKILAFFWMLVGAFAGLWLGTIPMMILRAVLLHFLPRTNPIVEGIGILLFIFVAMGASWFKRLFYGGMLWGYRPDSNS